MCREEPSDSSPHGSLRWFRLPAMFVILLIKVYQKCVSPLLGQHCRYYPSCSQYCLQAVHKYGVLRGCWRGFLRICRCHPWNAGGYDPP